MSCLGEAETSQAAWMRLTNWVTWKGHSNLLSCLQAVQWALCSALWVSGFRELSGVLGWALVLKMSFSHVCDGWVDMCVVSPWKSFVTQQHVYTLRMAARGQHSVLSSKSFSPVYWDRIFPQSLGFPDYLDWLANTSGNPPVSMPQYWVADTLPCLPWRGYQDSKAGPKLTQQMLYPLDHLSNPFQILYLLFPHSQTNCSSLSQFD